MILVRHRRTISAAASTVALLLVTLAPQEAEAFCRTTTCDPNAGDTCRKNDRGCIRDGVPLKWKTNPIVYRFYGGGSSKLEDDDAARKAIRRAFDAWENVQCSRGRTSLRFQEGSDIRDDKPIDQKEAPEKFGIYFRDDEWPHQDAEESIALTNQIYGKITGNIDYADIEINTAKTSFVLTDENRDGTDLQAVMTHEVGHYIGLAHSNDPDSIMVARYCQAGNDRCKGGIDRARDLSPDDETAVCAAYEPAGSSTPAQGCAEAGMTSPAEVASLFGFLFLASTLVRRRLRVIKG
jgi:hypothetical protein